VGEADGSGTVVGEGERAKLPSEHIMAAWSFFTVCAIVFVSFFRYSRSSRRCRSLSSSCSRSRAWREASSARRSRSARSMAAWLSWAALHSCAMMASLLLAAPVSGVVLAAAGAVLGVGWPVEVVSGLLCCHVGGGLARGRQRDGLVGE